MTKGGDGVPGLIISKEGRKVISNRMKRFYEENPEMKKIMTRRAHEENRKPENRKRISELQRKRYKEMTEEEHLEHIEKTKQGMSKLSTETKERIKEAQFKKGQKAWNKGLETPVDIRKKISNACKGRKTWNKGRKVEKKEFCPVCGKLICWNMLNRHIKARHS